MSAEVEEQIHFLALEPDDLQRMARLRPVLEEQGRGPRAAVIEDEHGLAAGPALGHHGEGAGLAGARLEEIGFRIAAYPLTLLSSAARAMEEALAALGGKGAPPGRLSFEDLRALVGFPEYQARLDAYDAD